MCSYVFIRQKSRLRVTGWDFRGKGVGMILRRPPSGYRLYHTMRFLTVLGLVWPRAIPGPFTGHWKMAVFTTRILPHHVM